MLTVLSSLCLLLVFPTHRGVKSGEKLVSLLRAWCCSGSQPSSCSGCPPGLWDSLDNQPCYSMSQRCPWVSTGVRLCQPGSRRRQPPALHKSRCVQVHHFAGAGSFMTRC